MKRLNNHGHRSQPVRKTLRGHRARRSILQLSRARRLELNNLQRRADLKRHIVDFKTLMQEGTTPALFTDFADGKASESTDDCLPPQPDELPFDTSPFS